MSYYRLGLIDDYEISGFWGDVKSGLRSTWDNFKLLMLAIIAVSIAVIVG